LYSSLEISIHAPHAGSDLIPNGLIQEDSKFQSTLPTRGATFPMSPEIRVFRISIHAPHAGSDLKGDKGDPGERDFNPRSPRGERHRFQKRTGAQSVFQSTLPTRGATRVFREYRAYRVFQSTLPTRGATPGRCGTMEVSNISIHAPHAGSDRYDNRVLCG